MLHAERGQLGDRSTQAVDSREQRGRGDVHPAQFRQKVWLDLMWSEADPLMFAASRNPLPAAMRLLYSLEREIHAGADHTKIIVWAVHEIPAEITDPADMRS